MIPDEYYMTTFFGLITIICILGMLPLFCYRTLDKFPEANLITSTVLLLLIVILFIGFRNPYGSWRYYGDTYKYTLIYKNIQSNPLWQSNKDYGFYYYMKLLANQLNIQSFYMVTASLYVLPVYYAFHKWFKKYAFFAVVLLVTSISFWPFGINGMRNGLATSFFIFALTFRKNRVIMYAIIALSITFHTSLLLPTLALVITEFYKNTKLLLKFWLGSVFLSFLFGRTIMNKLNLLVSSSIGQLDGRGDFSGVDISLFATSTYRIDFVLYSALVIGIGYYFTYKTEFKNKFFSRIFNIYIISNTVWMYFIYFPYTNRIAYLSWFLIPILVVYPIIYTPSLKNQSYFMAAVLTVSLIFVWIIAYI